MDSDGSCCSCSIARGLSLSKYRPRQEAGSRVDSDGRFCSCSIGLRDADYAFLSTAPSRRREVVWTRTDIAACARSDADYAFLSTALGRRRKIVWIRTEAAACARSDADYSLSSTAPSRRRKVSGIGFGHGWSPQPAPGPPQRREEGSRTEAAARFRSDADYAFLSTASSSRKLCGLGRKLLLVLARTRTTPSGVPPPVGGGK